MSESSREEDYTYFNADFVRSIIRWLSDDEQRKDHPEAIPKPTEEHIDKIVGIVQHTRGCGYYPDVKMQAFHVLYEIIKQHILYNGNKRVGLTIFLAYCVM